MTVTQRVRRLPRNVRLLGWVSFFQDAASELLYPIMPLFLTATLGAPAAIVGLIEGIAEATAAITKLLSGRLADRYARRPLIAIGYGISSVSKPIIGLAGGWPIVLGARFIDRVGKGIRTSPRDALIAAATAPEDRGRAFGFHRAADTAGAVVGPLLGVALYELLDHHLRPLFFIAALPAAISVGLIFLVREPPRTHVRPVVAPPRSIPAPRVAPAALPSSYWRLVALLAVFGLVNFTDALIILRLVSLGAGFVAVILAYALYNLSYAALSYPAGVLSDRLGRSHVYATGLLCFAIAYLGLGLARDTVWIWILMPIYGAYTALTDGVGKAWITDHLPTGALGTGLGTYQAITGGCSLIAGLWAGLSWGHDGHTPLLISGTATGLLTLYLITSNHGKAQSSNQSTRIA